MATRTKSTPQESRRGQKKAATGSAKRAAYPRHAVEKALRIPKAIYDQNAGKPTSTENAAKFTTGGKVTGPFRMEVASAKKYGFLRSEGKELFLEERARRAIAPQSNTDRIRALQEAVLAAPNMSAVYNHFRGENLPDDTFFRNALRDTFGIPSDNVSEFIDIFLESMRSARLIDESGDRRKLMEPGEDNAVASEATNPKEPTHITTEVMTCFVMQPFDGYLGSYYETIFKPAIEKAGLQAVRADDDIFATGKIMDQVWRGIRAATVLVAELTSKNPNVFYELGLAHALEKPVVLVSSKKEDVPFDLRHIRAIFYDHHDPSWGDKLINKISENIRSALDNPEDAIFRIEDE